MHRFNEMGRISFILRGDHDLELLTQGSNCCEVSAGSWVRESIAEDAKSDTYILPEVRLKYSGWSSEPCTPIPKCLEALR